MDLCSAGAWLLHALITFTSQSVHLLSALVYAVCTTEKENSKQRRDDMPCRRASTPAAAAAADPAVAAWPLTPLVLALAVFSAMPHVTLSRGRENQWPPLEGNSQLTTTKNLSCDEVPYPFGLKGKSAPGFRVTCRKNDSAAMLRIGHQKFRIDQVSSQEGFVVIFAGPIYRLCYDRNGRPVVGSTGIGPTNLTDTPFFFSKRNTLVATGCYSNFTATFTSSLHHHGWSTNGSCTTNGRVNSDGLCPGTACCDAYGMPLDDAQEVTFEFNKTSASVAGTCSAAFILYQKEQIFKVSGNSKPMHLHQEEHIFRAGGGDSKPVHLEDVLVPLGERRMVLDWVIGRATCEQARNNSFKTQYRCNNESSCMDRFMGEGYVCRCKAGYDQHNGNPYEAGGCQAYSVITLPEDILALAPIIRLVMATGQGQGALTPIGHLAPLPTTNRKDEQGVTSCVCPKGMIGDGQKNGSGCKKQFPLYTALGVALALTATLATVLLCYYLTMKKRKVERNRAELFRKNGGLLLQQRFSMMTSQGEDSSAKIFSAEELKDATDNYSESRILGRGGSGMVYKGILPNNTTVAIKKSILFDESQVEQFANEITILSQIDHPNVVKLLGCCLETNVPLLVYEFIPNGTLFQHIHNRSSLRWEDCLRIAEETAEALDYLHSTSSTPIIHRDIKSSNILLDENLMAKISDFGASRSVPFDQTHEIEPHILAEAGEEQIHAVAQLSVRCLNLKGEERPVMREVASVLHGLRESFDEEQIIRRSNESIQITNGQDSVHSEARPIPSLQSSGEITTEYSLPAEILPSSYLAR
ncbi:Os04g0598600 [Oryza sativa Japonica Group]|uniref:Os04g0598600 protein n=1 Tax=Oryza sativa subsp. japonica TaxID=39947 RepID=Q0JAI0_ORYSJ|nr:Os04g0598600 [Oryza sativa Japonica Group]|eukprot:NP_001053743.2 Os04g0598600 [Oryza sativa Japonica Group]